MSDNKVLIDALRNPLKYPQSQSQVAAMAGDAIEALTADLARVTAERDRYQRETERQMASRSDLLMRLQTEEHQFKNFHRLLCERFNYAHDEVDWKRDQLSLIEHIAGHFAAAEAELDAARRDLRLCRGHDILAKFRMIAAERDDLLDKLIAERTKADRAREALQATMNGAPGWYDIARAALAPAQGDA